MNDLNFNLLNSSEISETFFSWPLTGGSKGSFNPMYFIIRLRSDLHKELDQVKPGVHSAHSLTKNQIQAFSTLLHETIHWWQHIGSNFGFIHSLKYAAQAHMVHKHLDTLLKTRGAFKSIIKYDKSLKIDDPSINLILNYWHDLEIASNILRDPKTIRKNAENPYFLSVGHSYHMMWSAFNQMLAVSFDKDFSFLPKVEVWSEKFKNLRENNVNGYYLGSPIAVPPIGIGAIYEGQARFSQLQYLYFALEKKYSLYDFAKEGMLNGIYIEAMSHFLKTIGEEWPSTPADSIVGLFLLVCDLAINSPEGFPIDLYHYESFIVSNDPGFRFHSLCLMIRDRYPELKSAIRNYSKEEYIEVSRILSSSIVCRSPFEGLELISQWIKNEKEIKKLLEEERYFKYSQENLPVRLLFSKYLRFQEDKFENPQLFCWPGISFINHPFNKLKLEEVELLFFKHGALIRDDINGDIYPTLFKGYSEEQIVDTYNQFITWNCNYDMVRKWIVEDGPFTFNYHWLSSKYSKKETDAWICGNFERLFKCNPNTFKIP